jgi:hypothetical protein
MTAPAKTRSAAFEALVDSIMEEPSARSVCDELGINDSLRRLRALSSAQLDQARCEMAVQS